MNDTPDYYPRKTESAPDLEVKLTALALGELDLDEAAALERQLQADAALRAQYESIQATVSQLEAALKSEPAPGLTGEQRDAIIHGGAALRNDDARPVIFTLRRVWAGVGLAAAACLAIVLIPMMTTGSRSSGDETFAIAPAEAARESSDRLAGRSESLLPGKKEAPASAAGDATAWQRATATADSLDQDGALAQSNAPASARQESESLLQKDSSGRDDAAAEADSRAGGAAGTGSGAREKQSDPGGAGPEAGRAGAADSPGSPGAPGATGNDKFRTVPPASVRPDASVTLPSERRSSPKRLPPGARGVPTAPAAPATSPPPPPSRPRRRAAGAASEADSGGAPGFGGGGSEGASESNRGATFGDGNTEEYNTLVDNPFVRAIDQGLSTFSIDVDTASYSNVRRFLNAGSLPPKDAVRIEEMINYFDYAYEPATGETPFSVTAQTTACPWNEENQLLRIGLRGRTVERDMRPATSLVFLLDVSGSMRQPNKLPLLKESMRLLVNNLTADDRVAIVVYAGTAGLVLPSTYCDDKVKILESLDNLRAGGSTNGGAGIQLAYKVAEESFIKDGVNRVILCTDGDLNVGVTSQGDLDRLIEDKRESGVFLSVLGFGAGNWSDARMESLSNKGNGNSAYIDSLDEAKKVLVEEMSGTLVTIAKDVKIQVDFNPARVGAYRLIGYANRMLEAQDFADDRKDAGEIGAGHTVTALYELIPAGSPALEDEAVPAAPGSEFVKTGELIASDLLLKVKLRYKQPDGDVSTEIAYPVTGREEIEPAARADLQFAAAVASFGMLLRDSEHMGTATFASVLDLAAAGLENDKHERRAEFTRMVEKARALSGAPKMMR